MTGRCHGDGTAPRRRHRYKFIDCLLATLIKSSGGGYLIAGQSIGTGNNERDWLSWAAALPAS